MRAVLSDVTDGQHVAGRQLKLQREVPLLDFRWPDVGIPQADVRVLDTDLRVVSPKSPWSSVVFGNCRPGCCRASWNLGVERRIQRQAEVGAGAFHEGGDGIGAAHHHSLAQDVRSVGEADARLEVLLVRVVERAAVAVLAGQFQLRR